jgi:hypothetical protein
MAFMILARAWYFECALVLMIVLVSAGNTCKFSQMCMAGQPQGAHFLSPAGRLRAVAIASGTVAIMRFRLAIRLDGAPTLHYTSPNDEMLNISMVGER